LHYEYLSNGVHMDPQTVHLAGAEPLHAEALARFLTGAAPLLGSVSTPAPTMAAAGPAAAGPQGNTANPVARASVN
jgi:hypothetical protein